jgi:hypothetical protein
MRTRTGPAWEVFTKQGKGWSGQGTFDAPSDLDAARKAHRLLHRNIIGVRPDHTELPIRVFRFNPKTT